MQKMDAGFRAGTAAILSTFLSWPRPTMRLLRRSGLLILIYPLPEDDMRTLGTEALIDESFGGGG